MNRMFSGCLAAMATGGLTAALLAAPPSANAAPAADAATTSARQFAKAEGVKAGSIKLDRTISVPGGKAVHFQQYLAGTPIIGAEVVVQLDSAGKVHGVDGTLSPTPNRAVKAKTTVSKAKKEARAALRSAGATQVKETSDATTALAWYDEAIVNSLPATGKLRLVHDVTVSPAAVDAIGGRVLVDATTGKELLTITSERQINRSICDARNTRITTADCPNPVRVEGGPATSVAEVNNAYTRFGTASTYFTNRFNYDLSTRIGGGTLRATVRACYNTGVYECPTRNAGWTGTSMIFGDGYASADDVITHELTHGVTDNSSDLIYQGESGALNEGFSDIFGEYEDLSNGAGTDTAAVRWLLGEDLPGGSIRNMKAPQTTNQPDTYKGTYWASTSSSYDKGGVHINSGVINKTAFLLTDGQTFGGQTITGLGATKAEQLFWRTEKALTSSSTFRQFATALKSSCSAMASSGSYGFTTSNCAQVDKAVLATKM